MRILITRPLDDAKRTAEKLTALGHRCHVAPMLTIVERENIALAFDDVQAIIVTSANGIRALAPRTPVRDVPVFAVGEHSASVARGLGFADVKSADGDVVALTRAIEAWAVPEGGALLHAAASKTAGQLRQTLEQRGYRVRTAVLYDAVVAQAFDAQTRDMLAAGEIDTVLFYSPRTAAAFADCVREAGLIAACRRIIALFISSAAAARCAALPFAQVRIAVRPNEDDLLKLLQP